MQCVSVTLATCVWILSWQKCVSCIAYVVRSPIYYLQLHSLEYCQAAGTMTWYHTLSHVTSAVHMQCIHVLNRYMDQ